MFSRSMPRPLHWNEAVRNALIAKIGGLADAISRGPKTEQWVQDLVDKGYLLNDNGLSLSKKGFACVDSASFRNRAMRVGRCVLRVGLSVVAVLIGNWLWHLMQSSLS